MIRKNKLPELLAPAGDFECLLAAVAGGADAIYVGGKRFGARAYAKNFDTEELCRAVDYCHLHGVKLYVTLNTLVEDSELSDAVKYAAELYRIGVDALIVADIGAVSEIRRHVPNLELHASTQMSVHNSFGVDAAASLGCSRVVLARELPISDIKAICENSNAEIEIFLHGALCVCHSGQCLFSSLVGGRSGNRGECAQPCRLPYNSGKYPLSLKDLSLANHINSLIDSGVASLKIEGRMKSPSYVYTVVSVYRKLLDEARGANAEENEKLRRAFSRDGFTDGYLVGNIKAKMTGIRSEGDKEDSRGVLTEKFEPIRKTVRALVKMHLGKPAEMTLTDGVRSVTVFGDTPATAERAPLDTLSVKERLSKMGNTFLSLATSDIEISLDDGINLSPSSINALRRCAAERFESSRRESVEIPDIDYVKRAKEQSFAAPRCVSAQFLREDSFIGYMNSKSGKMFDYTFVPLTSSDAALKLSNGIYMPPVVFEHEVDVVRNLLKNARKQGVLYALVGNIGHISLARECGFEIYGDFRLNITNAESKAVYDRMGVENALVSPELTLPKARDIGGGVIVYGRIPLMITERCFIRENFGCERCDNALLTDRKGEKFPIMREFEHRNLILNSAFTYMGDKPDMLRKHRITSQHFIFSTENAEGIRYAVDSYRAARPLKQAVRRVGRREFDKK